MGKKERKQENETLRQIFRVYLWPQKGRLAVITLLILLGVLLGNLSPYLYGIYMGKWWMPSMQGI